MHERADNARVYDFTAARQRKRGTTDFRPTLSKRQLANHLRKSTKWVELRVREGMPAGWDARERERRFDLLEVLAWLEDRAA